MDLKAALFTKGVLTPKQRKYMLLWIAGYKQQEIGIMCEVGQDVVSVRINLAIKNISKYLR